MSKKVITVTEQHIKAANAIMDNLKDRSGIGNVIEECDRDIQFEITRDVAWIIAKNFQKVESNEEM